MYVCMLLPAYIFNMNTSTEKWFVFCLVMGLISKAKCTAEQPAEESNMEDDTYDYIDYDYSEYDDNGDNETDQNDRNNSKSATKDLPYFEKASVYISADPNSDVILNCDVRNFHVNNAIIWYKEKMVYSHGQYTVNQRVEILKNNSILLKNIQPEDAGVYFCEVIPENIRLQIVLEVNETLSITCDGRNVLDRTIVFRQDEYHICECKTRVSDKSNIKWSHNGNRFDKEFGELMDGSIILNVIEDHHAGVYQCLDDDGSEKPRHGMFNIEVLYKPKVTTHRHHINTELGGSAELYCDFRANPISVTTWLKNNQAIKYSEKYMITLTTENYFNRSTLSVKNVTVHDLGEYICQAENSLGSNELRTHLMLEPEKGQLESFNIDGKKVILHWIVRSLQPLSEAVLDYKMSGSYTWSSTKVIQTQRHENGIWNVTHEIELIEGEWQTRMRTKNIVGWSKFSAPFSFKIDDKDVLTNDKSNEKIAMAGFGAKANSTSTKILSLLSQSFVLVTFVIKCYFNYKFVI